MDHWLSYPRQTEKKQLLLKDTDLVMMDNMITAKLKDIRADTMTLLRCNTQEAM